VNQELGISNDNEFAETVNGKQITENEKTTLNSQLSTQNLDMDLPIIGGKEDLIEALDNYKPREVLISEDSPEHKFLLILCQIVLTGNYRKNYSRFIYFFYRTGKNITSLWYSFNRN